MLIGVRVALNSKKGDETMKQAKQLSYLLFLTGLLTTVISILFEGGARPEYRESFVDATAVLSLLTIWCGLAAVIITALSEKGGD